MLNYFNIIRGDCIIQIRPVSDLRNKFVDISRIVHETEELTGYIAYILNAPKVAVDLVDELDISISKLQEFPYVCGIYHLIESFETEYRMLPVKNYLVFYVALEHEVEIHRIIYEKMDLQRYIK